MLIATNLSLTQPRAPRALPDRAGRRRYRRRATCLYKPTAWPAKVDLTKSVALWGIRPWRVSPPATSPWRLRYSNSVNVACCPFVPYIAEGAARSGRRQLLCCRRLGKTTACRYRLLPPNPQDPPFLASPQPQPSFLTVLGDGWESRSCVRLRTALIQAKNRNVYDK